MFHQRGGIRSEEILTLTYPDNQRTPLTGCKKFVRFILTGHHDPIRTLHLVERHEDSKFCRKITFEIEVFDQIHQNLSVRIAGESNAPALQVPLNG